MTFSEIEQARAVRWKAHTAVLPEEARARGPYVVKAGGTNPRLYDYCLPSAFAAHNLLPEVRPMALQLFAELDIPWHAGVDDGPSTHLLSSQVQCVNALGQMVSAPDRIVHAFGPALGTREVHQIEPGRWLTFEYIGEQDLLNEAVRGIRRRGTHCTSVDAAFMHTTTDGVRELVLIEWKYTESYGPRKVDPEKDATRRRRYEQLLLTPGGPMVMDLLPFDELLQEPLYQLMRQQLLAHELEKSRAHGVERVRVVHFLPAGNEAYRASLHGDAVRALGDDVSSVWQQLLLRPDRFVAMDHSIFTNPLVTADEYVSRYHGASD